MGLKVVNCGGWWWPPVSGAPEAKGPGPGGGAAAELLGEGSDWVLGLVMLTLLDPLIMSVPF